MTLNEGETLGRYTINRLIGKGGWGEVYEAVDPELDRRIALKLLTSRLAVDPDMQRRFAREARTVAALDHPNIVTIHSVEEVDGHRFITMQLVSGQTLSKLIPDNGMQLDELFRVAIPLADAVAAAHAGGVTHRDIKPANVMVANDGQVKVLDFGLAKLMPQDDGETLVSGPTPAGSVMGTLNYMSPEQLRGEEADPRSDIFSLGVVLYEMATGSLPFQGQSSLDVVASILRDRPTEVTEVRRALPNHLGRIIRICLQERPEKRYQDASDVRNELEHLKDELHYGGPGAATSGRERGRRGWLIGGAAAALALLAVLGSFVLGRNGAPPPAAPIAATATETTRIVVLPFEDLGEPDVEFFSPGLTEEITSRLAAVEGLGVISPMSANQYAGTSKTAQEIGEELGVGYILRGSVQWATAGSGGRQVSIRPNLIRVADDTQMRSDPYVGSVRDIFQVQSEIATRVAQQLGRALSASAGEVAQRPTANLEAYQAYLRGLHYAHRPVYTLDNWSLALQGFADAVAEDPDFAGAWAWLARGHSFIVHLGVDTSAERRAAARQAIDRARELAPDRAEVRVARGYYYYWVENDHPSALREFAAAERQLPDHWEIHEGKGYVLRRQGRWAEAVDSLLRAFDLNPRAADLAAEIADAYLWQREYGKALGWCDQSIALDPDQVWAYFSKAQAQRLAGGELSAARETLDRMPPSDDTQWVWTWFWQEMYEGRFEQAIARLDGIAGPWVQGWEGTEPVALLRAQALEEMGDGAAARPAYSDAERLLREELVASPEEPWRLAVLGLAEAGLGRGEEAVRQARRATELLPTSRDAVSGTSLLTNLALVYARTGRHAEALDLLEQLLSRPSMVSPPLLRHDPRWAVLEEEPRMRALLGGG